MPINEIAEAYLSSLTNHSEVEGGLSFADYLHRDKLDFSLESLKYVDAMLDAIRDSSKPDDYFLDQQANINFLYLLAFYVGQVIAQSSGDPAVWYQYDEWQHIGDNRKLTGVIENTFSTSVMCLHHGVLYIPLSAIMIRLFEGPDEKSVWYSAAGQIAALREKRQKTENNAGIIRNAKPWWKLW